MNKPIKRIYFITFHLCLGILLLGMPQAYSASTKEEDKAGFKYAMQVYNKGNSIEKPNNYTITPEEALAEIKTELRLTPIRGQWLASGYIRKSFSQNRDKKYFPKEITFLILNFIVTQDSYTESAQKILSWATEHRMGFYFITDYLKETYKLRRFYGKDSLSILTFSLSSYQLDIYLHKNNFSEKDLLLWLINDLKWNMSSTKRMEKYHQTFRMTKSRHLRRKVENKLCKLIILHVLKGKKFALYSSLCDRFIQAKGRLSFKKMMDFI